MSVFSISGIASGIDTTSLISQLMQVAAAPQTQLKNQVTQENKIIAAYQSINTKLTAISTAALDLKLSGTWDAAKVASSDSSVVATASSKALPGSSATFDVTSVAKAQTSTFATSGGTVISGTPTFDITVGSTTTSVSASSGSATDVASAINLAGLGVRAAVVNTDSGQVLQMTSTKTGSDGAFTVAGLDSAQQDIIGASNAQITVGDPLAGGYTVTSQTNTFTDVLPGVTFSVSKVATGVNLSLSSDTEAISNKVKSLVDAVNGAYSEIGKDTAKDGVLFGNSSLSRLGQSILSIFSSGTAGGVSYTDYGIDMDKNGAISFDSAKFTAALSQDATTTKSIVGTTLAAALDTFAQQATDPINGVVPSAIKSEQSTVTSLNKQIDSWTARLADMQTTMQQKYTAMELAVSKLQSTSNWLTSALAGMTAQTSTSN